MKYLARLTSALLGLLLLVALIAKIAHADDGIFPPAPAAAPYINFDGRGFLLNGQRTFIASGGMEYCRVPRALWRDRLLRLKRAGFNTVEIYNMWNFHEPKKGQFDFSGDHDLNAFLKLVKAMDLYAIVRVGPYVCAEWDSGGYPVKIAVDGLYLPECWQKSGRNELVIFDEEGHSPAQVKVQVEQAAGRVVVPMTER